MPQALPDISADLRQAGQAHLAASVKGVTEALSRDCIAAGLKFMSDFLTLVSLEAQDVIDSAERHSAPVLLRDLASERSPQETEIQPEVGNVD